LGLPLVFSPTLFLSPQVAGALWCSASFCLRAPNICPEEGLEVPLGVFLKKIGLFWSHFKKKGEPSRGSARFVVVWVGARASMGTKSLTVTNNNNDDDDDRKRMTA
jgi:hypothetical protein